jgi:hypothetical protein
MSGSPVFSNRTFFFRDGDIPTSFNYVEAVGKAYTFVCTAREFERVFGATPFRFCSLSVVKIDDSDLIDFTGDRDLYYVNLGIVLKDAPEISILNNSKTRIRALIKHLADQGNVDPVSLEALIEHAEKRIKEQVNEYRKKLVDEFRKEIDERVAKKLKTKK